jgi:phage terminase small subunit
MTPRQRRFVECYLVSLNAAAAAREAGYAENSAANRGHRLLQMPVVRAAIDAATRERAAQAEIEQLAVLRELRTIFLSSVNDYEIDSENRVQVKPGVPASAIKAVSSVRWHRDYDFDGKLRGEVVKITLWDKPKALSLAMRFLGILHDKLEVTTGEEAARKMIAEAAGNFDKLINQIGARVGKK